LLSNIVLDELDQELEKRGHRFVRYADDCNIYVKTRRAGERVKASVTQFIESQLKLKVNQAKSAVDRPWKRKFLGFSIDWGKQSKVRVAKQSL
jgi:RNA-directed DNA polymerase